MENCDDAAIPNTKRRAATNASINIAKRQASNLKRVSSLLRKKRAYKPLSEEQEKFLQANSELVKQFYKRREKRTELLNRQNECEDFPNVLEEKCQKLAQAIHDAEFLIVYTGAGISTAASIPDYRGPNGIWTRLQKGKDIGHHDLTTAEPTFHSYGSRSSS
ncbi:NAD-dependent protein deacetylase Sirt6 [Armadillidium nasatum]|uniref:NAD-dependent protein deacetylase Sirt6 n=1 Tax=Armadillidium nasatum TaxID=96803 RepID=A0A5N5TKI1_9CRUS|nr:NAD-dependent protein deacetylase Sirt6 [Armadillidium nasatum]